jgi:ubiquinone/menaquinone biosynthesis C-methylase UbiE
MPTDLERDVAAHYGTQDLVQKLLAGLSAAGVDPSRLTVKDLGPIDEFHIGGRAATEHAVAKMALTANMHVLDVGCGIGGASRYLASAIGCRVTGIDLTPEYIEAARELSRRTGLSDKITYQASSALAMPLADASFDAAITLHVAMNIKDRDGLYGEVARVLKPGAQFCVYDVMKGETGGLHYPVPWAETAETSHLTTPVEMQALLERAGFTVEQVEDRRDFAITFFRERLAQAPGGGPPSALNFLMSNPRVKSENMLANIEQGRISPVVMIARKC